MLSKNFENPRDTPEQNKPAESDDDERRYNGFAVTTGAKRPETISFNLMGGFDWAMFSHWKKIDGQTLQLHFHTGQISVKGRGLFERLKTDPNTLCFLEHIKMKRVKEVWESGKEEAVMVDTVEVIFAE